MPHLRLEYSSNLPAGLANRGLLVSFHEILTAHGVSLGNCKSRVDRRDLFVVGDGSRDEAFVHLDVRLLEGRTEETTAAMGRALLACLVRAYAGATPEPQITVEVQGIRRAEYFKHPPGTI